MVKRKFAAVVAATILGAFASLASAQPVPVAVEGCAKLARVVYAEVSSAALYGPGRSGPWVIDQGQADLSVCEHTAKTVSQAFTSALRDAGIALSWGPEDSRNGDYCWSGFLSQCYPGRDRLSYSVAAKNFGFVARSWAIVSQSVMREMHNPFSSDEIRFRDDDLKLRLGLSLRSIGAADEQ